MGTLGRWREDFLHRIRYSAPSRAPFFELAGEYLPADPAAVVVDIGAGDGSFARQLGLRSRYRNLRLLEGNPSSVAHLREEYEAVDEYRAPGRLPFADGSVAYIHMSHLIEHLPPEALYELLRECDRVLATEGVLVISAPLLWERFYEDMSHVKPYYPAVFTNYLSAPRENASAARISSRYETEELVYRFRASQGDSAWGSRFFVADALLRAARAVRGVLGFRLYRKNGFTLVLRKLGA